VLASNGSRDFANTRFGGGIVFGGNVQFGELATVVSLASSSANLSFANNVSLGSANRTLTQGNNGTNKFSGIIANTGSGGVSFAANASTDGRFEITNSSNTFTGDITVSGGEVRFTTDGSMGDAANDIIIDGGRFSKASDATTVTLGAGRAISVGDGAGTSISSPGTGTLIYNNAISNKTGETGSWAKQGGGTLELGGVSTYTGSTAINNGILKLTTGNDRLPTGTVVSMGQAASANLGTLDLNGNSQTIAGLSSTAGTNAGTNTNVVTSALPTTLTINNSANQNFSSGTAADSGVITGTIALVKEGIGTQTLGGINTYSGSTTINDGTLALSGTGTIGSGNVTLDGGTLSIAGISSTSYTLSASQTVAGSGFIDASAKTLALNGILAPGFSAGTIEVTGNLILGAVSVSNFEIFGDGAGQFDQLSVDGLLTMDGTLNLLTTGTYTPGDFVQLFDATNYSGAFTTITGTDIGGGLEWDTSTLATNGIITVIPEPSTVGLLGLSALALLRRRKR
jgi:autotransporter-associated beta strand protein